MIEFKATLLAVGGKLPCNINQQFFLFSRSQMHEPSSLGRTGAFPVEPKKNSVWWEDASPA
jgi:hypothetical protein